MISLASPVMIGIYSNDKLFEQFVSEGRASDFLVEIFDYIKNKYEIDSIIYANGPGSFMGIKVSYVILKTISIIIGCKFYAVSGFELNNGGPIRANKLLSFVLNDDKIILQKISPVDFNIPKDLSKINLNIDTLPNYIVEVV